jgi:hypothetical protein
MWWGRTVPRHRSGPTTARMKSPQQGEGTSQRMPPLRKLQPRESRSQESQPQKLQPQKSPSPQAVEPLSGLNEVTWQRIRADPRVARLVKPVWSRLDELEYAGHDPGALAALRYTLTLHQPTRRGTCRLCRWRSWPIGWWGRRWPCIAWIQVRAELFDDGILPRKSGHEPLGQPTVG